MFVFFFSVDENMIRLLLWIYKTLMEETDEDVSYGKRRPTRNEMIKKRRKIKKRMKVRKKRKKGERKLLKDVSIFFSEIRP